MIYSKSSELLEKSGIEQYYQEKINNIERIELLNKTLYQNEELPINIIKKKNNEEVVSNQSLYEGQDNLPSFIIKQQVKITDKEEILRINKHKKENFGSNPKGVSTRVIHSLEGNQIDNYYYTNKFAYYRLTYDFYEKIPLSDEEISFKISALNSYSLMQISSTLLFFKYLVIVLLVLNFLVFMVALSTM